LLTARDGTEDNLGEPSGREGTVADASDDLKSSLNDGERAMIPVVDETSDILFGHHGELLLESVRKGRRGREGRVSRNETDANEGVGRREVGRTGT
jgi:hypothetical protein